MSTPSGEPENPWQQPGEPVPPPSAPPAYGQPSSPSYGKYGQGTALPTPPPQPPGQQGHPGQPGQQGGTQWAQPNQAGQPQWGQQQPGQQPGQPQWGQPGYTPQQQWIPPGGPTTVQPTGRLTPAVIALSVLTGVGLVVGAAASPNQNQFLKDTFNGVTTTPPPGSTGYDVGSSLVLLVEILVWVTACLWLTRVRQNAVVLNPRGQRHSDIWVWIGWIIPIVNLWFPKQIVDDAITSTATAAGVPRIRTGFWWTSWLAAMVLGISLAVLSLLPPNDGLHRTLVAADAVVTLVGLVLWVRIVRWLASTQDALRTKPEVANLER